MPIRFLCENDDCRKPLRVRDELAGKRVKCPQCGQLVTAPTSSPAAKTPAPKAKKEPAKPSSKAVSPAANAMQQRLDALAEELDAVPKEGDMLKNTMVTVLKGMGKVLPMLVGMDGTASEKDGTLQNAESSLKSAVKVLGENHRAVILLRKMLATIRE